MNTVHNVGDELEQLRVLEDKLRGHSYLVMVEEDFQKYTRLVRWKSVSVGQIFDCEVRKYHTRKEALEKILALSLDGNRVGTTLSGINSVGAAMNELSTILLLEGENKL